MRVEARESALGRGSLPNCGGNAANRKSHALSTTNASEMPIWPFPDSFFPNNVTKMREFSFRVAFPTTNVSEKVKSGSF